MATISSSLLFGREEALAEIRALLDQAADGRAATHVVSGEAGIGKSRLVTEVLALATDSGWRTLTGGCLDLSGGGIPLLPLLEALRRLSRSLPAEELAALLGRARAELAPLLPELQKGGRVRISAALVGDSEVVTQARLFEAVLGFLGRLGEATPTLVVIEDVHWIDRATRDLVTFLVHNLTRERILLILTARTDDLPAEAAIASWLAELGRRPHVTRRQLQRLGRAEVAGQLEAILGGPPDDETVDAIWKRSSGNPFFVEELAAGQGAAGDGPPPITLLEILAVRLGGLSQPTRDLLLAVAIAGRPVGEALLEAVTGTPSAELRASLREALGRQVIGADPATGAYLFRHELLREAVEHQSLAGERADLHGRYAETLAARADLADPSPVAATAELARHWHAAGRVSEALSASIEAGVAAETVAAHAQAHRHFERALALMAGDAPRADRLTLLQRAADAADLAGKIPRAVELVTLALALADARADPRLVGLLHSRLGYLRWAQGDGASGILAHEEAVRLIPAQPPTPERARVLGALGGALMGAGRYVESRLHCETAIACAMACGARSEEARARNMLGSDLVALGDVDRGLEELRLSTAMAVETGPPEMRVVTRHNLALNLAQSGRLGEALVEAHAALAEARSGALERRYGMDLMALRADVLTRLGQWPEALDTVEQALSLDPAGRGTTYLSAAAGRLDALRGEAGAARERLATAEQLAAGEMDPDLKAFASRGLAENALAAGRPIEALGIVRDVLPQLDSGVDPFGVAPLVALGLQAAAELAEDARARTDGDALAYARAQTAPLRTTLEQLEGRRSDPALAGQIALAEAELGRLEGGSDVALWERAAAAFDRLGDRYLVAYARYRAGEAELRAHGVRGAARGPLGEAHAEAARLGARPLLERVEALGGRARIAFPVSDSSPAAPRADPPGTASADVAAGTALSPRELEVLSLVAGGRTNGEIAELLFISRKTAGVHVTHILDKLGVSNRVEAAMIAARLGLASDFDGGPALSSPRPDRPS